MPKTEFLQIRLTPEERQRIETAAGAEHLRASTWARKILLTELDRLEGRRRSGDDARRVAES